jgi:hypothetical protein
MIFAKDPKGLMLLVHNDFRLGRSRNMFPLVLADVRDQVPLIIDFYNLTLDLVWHENLVPTIGMECLNERTFYQRISTEVVATEKSFEAFPATNASSNRLDEPNNATHSPWSAWPYVSTHLKETGCFWTIRTEKGLLGAVPKVGRECHQLSGCMDVGHGSPNSYLSACITNTTINAINNSNDTKPRKMTIVSC